MDLVIERTPKDHIVILGVDAQQCFDPLKALDCHEIMGEFVMGHRDRRGDCFLKLLYAFNLHLPQTYVEEFDTRYTCFNNGRSDPKQIDYMATSAPKKWVAQSKVAETNATFSDYWPLSMGLLPRTPYAEVEADGRQKDAYTDRLGIQGARF